MALAGCARSCRATAPPEETAPSAAAWLTADLDRLSHAPPELQQRIVRSPHALFRFVNQSWMQQVCEAFSDELRSLPAVRLHGDAHVEQYAVTADARGLDDFDDSATGPAVIDLVRFLGSVELTADQRGWSHAREAITNQLFDGYARALKDPGYLPPDPAVVRRLREEPLKTSAEFLAWAESLMRPLPAEFLTRFKAGWPRFEEYARETDPALTPAYVRVKRVGWLEMGIGSALRRKLLVRVEGRTAAPEDDRIIEGKEVVTLRGVSCLDIPKSGEVFRPVEGPYQVGRLRNRILVVVPLVGPGRPESRGWWVRTWDPSYKEMEIEDLASVQELVEIAHDVGAQLGSANLAGIDDAVARQKRLMELETISRLDPQIREVAHRLAFSVLEAWQHLAR